MKIIKHLIKVPFMISKQIFCKHEDIDKSSCPFTGMTYSTCLKCWKRIAVVRTDG